MKKKKKTTLQRKILRQFKVSKKINGKPVLGLLAVAGNTSVRHLL